MRINDARHRNCRWRLRLRLVNYRAGAAAPVEERTAVAAGWNRYPGHRPLGAYVRLRRRVVGVNWAWLR